MIVFALLGVVVIYAFGLSCIYKRAQSLSVVDLGFLFSTFIFIYTAIPAAVFIFLDLGEIPGWPWQELSKLNPTQEALADHLWRHNLFLGLFLVSYFSVRRFKPEAIVLSRMENIRFSVKQCAFVFLFFLFFAAVKYSLSEVSTTYSDKYLQVSGMAPWKQVVMAITNRALVGIQYILLICVATLQVERSRKILIFFMIILYQLVESYGSRIEAMFALLQVFAVYNIFIKRVGFKKFLAAGFLLILAAGFFEVFRYYEFNLNEFIAHIGIFGITAAGELNAVFSTGFHLYSVSEANKMPQTDMRMFIYDFGSIFQSNSNAEFNPQYWYWRKFYPDSFVPPQTNGPIADSAVWGGGIYDLAIRASIIGVMFGWVANRCLSAGASLFWLIVYVFYYSTCVMTLKYSVFWQLNPLIKTIIPIFIIYSWCKRISWGKTCG